MHTVVHNTHTVVHNTHTVVHNTHTVVHNTHTPWYTSLTVVHNTHTVVHNTHTHGTQHTHRGTHRSLLYTTHIPRYTTHIPWYTTHTHHGTQHTHRGTHLSLLYTTHIPRYTKHTHTVVHNTHCMVVSRGSSHCIRKELKATLVLFSIVVVLFSIRSRKNGSLSLNAFWHGFCGLRIYVWFAKRQVWMNGVYNCKPAVLERQLPHPPDLSDTASTACCIYVVLDSHNVLYVSFHTSYLVRFHSVLYISPWSLWLLPGPRCLSTLPLHVASNSPHPWHHPDSYLNHPYVLI